MPSVGWIIGDCSPNTAPRSDPTRIRVLGAYLGTNTPRSDPTRIRVTGIRVRVTVRVAGLGSELQLQWHLVYSYGKIAHTLP